MLMVLTRINNGLMDKVQVALIITNFFPSVLPFFIFLMSGDRGIQPFEYRDIQKKGFTSVQVLLLNNFGCHYLYNIICEVNYLHLNPEIFYYLASIDQDKY
jgi:hypothetical protein